jgi:hypothetical protein
MRLILTRILIIERGELVPEDDDTNWRSLWLRFSEPLPGVVESPDLDLSDGVLHNAEDVEIWIDTAVSSFSSKSGLFDRLLDIRRQEVGQ